MDELKITLTMLDIDWKDYWENNRKHGDIVFSTSVFKKQSDLEPFIINLLESNGFEYKIKEYVVAYNSIVVYNKRW